MRDNKKSIDEEFQLHENEGFNIILGRYTKELDETINKMILRKVENRNNIVVSEYINDQIIGKLGNIEILHNVKSEIESHNTHKCDKETVIYDSIPKNIDNLVNSMSANDSMVVDLRNASPRESMKGTERLSPYYSKVKKNGGHVIIIVSAAEKYSDKQSLPKGNKNLYFGVFTDDQAKVMSIETYALPEEILQSKTDNDVLIYSESGSDPISRLTT